MALLKCLRNGTGSLKTVLRTRGSHNVENLSQLNAFQSLTRCIVPPFVRTVVFDTREEMMEARFSQLKDLTSAELFEALNKKFETSGPPGIKELTLFLDKCNSSEDADLALQMVTRYRMSRMRQRVMAGFPEEVTLKLTQACARGERMEIALDALVRSRELGLKVCETTIGEIKAAECNLDEEKVDHVTSSYDRMKVLKVFPGESAIMGVVLALLKGGEQERATIFLRNLKDAGHSDLEAVDALLQ